MVDGTADQNGRLRPKLRKGFQSRRSYTLGPKDLGAYIWKLRTQLGSDMPRWVGRRRPMVSTPDGMRDKRPNLGHRLPLLRSSLWQRFGLGYSKTVEVEI